MKLGMIIKEVSSMHSKKFGMDMYMHANTMLIKMHAHFFIW